MLSACGGPSPGDDGVLPDAGLRGAVETVSGNVALLLTPVEVLRRDRSTSHTVACVMPLSENAFSPGIDCRSQV
jgi:hypothetical protein